MILKCIKAVISGFPREEAQELDEDEYYVADLIGMDVLLENGSKFGTLKDVMETGANDVYVVDRVHGEEILLPAIMNVFLMWMWKKIQ